MCVVHSVVHSKLRNNIHMYMHCVLDRGTGEKRDKREGRYTYIQTHTYYRETVEERGREKKMYVYV